MQLWLKGLYKILKFQEVYIRLEKKLSNTIISLVKFISLDLLTTNKIA